MKGAKDCLEEDFEVSLGKNWWVFGAFYQKKQTPCILDYYPINSKTSLAYLRGHFYRALQKLLHIK